jgi:hypothetical protein
MSRLNRVKVGDMVRVPPWVFTRDDASDERRTTPGDVALVREVRPCPCGCVAEIAELTILRTGEDVRGVVDDLMETS